jgi:hypothetical protein
LRGSFPVGSSPLACIGLAVANPDRLSNLLYLTAQRAAPAGEFDGIRVLRWQDPSGAALVLGCEEKGRVVDVIPTFAAAAGGIFADCRLINKPVAVAAVVDEDGTQLTALAFEAEQYQQIKALGQPTSGHARITALGLSVHVHADDDAYRVSPDSLFDPSGEHGDEVRMGPRSFISYGAFAAAGIIDAVGAAEPTAHARLAGVVLRASHRTCALTGQGFSIATVQSSGFVADMCLADTEHPVTPAPGNIISGTVLLTAAFVSEAVAGGVRYV